MACQRLQSLEPGRSGIPSRMRFGSRACQLSRGRTRRVRVKRDPATMLTHFRPACNSSDHVDWPGIPTQEETVKSAIGNLTIGLVFTLALAYAGCSSKPETELGMAKSAMEEAQTEDAPDYAPDDWARARQNWEEAQALIAEGRYRESRSILIEATGKFNNARDVARERRTGLVNEVKQLQSDITTQLGKLKESLNSSRLPAGIRTEAEQALPWIDEKIDLMRGEVAESKFLDARSNGKEALGRIYELQTRIDESGR